MLENRQTPLVPRACPTSPAALAFVWRVAAGTLPVDDAYLTCRYAANLAGRAGFVFQAGEKVLGTSSPLMAMILAGLAALFDPGSRPGLALILNAAADTASVLLVGYMGRRTPMPRTGVLRDAAALASIRSRRETTLRTTPCR